MCRRCDRLVKFIDGVLEDRRRPFPSLKYFRKMVMRLQSSGSFRGPRPEGWPSSRCPDFDLDVALALGGVNHVSVWRVLRDDGKHPYNFQKTQGSLETDLGGMVFYRWYRDQVGRSPDFASSVLWKDEATFTQAGVSNVHNEHLWTYSNPHASSE